MFHRYRITALLCRLAILLATVAAQAALPALAQREPPRVIASFSILADIAAQVAGDAATVTSLMPIGANPHSYTPSAQDVARLSDADLVLVVGANYEETLLPVVEQAAGERTAIVSLCVPIRPIPTGAAQPEDEDAAAHPDEAPAADSEITSRCAEHIRTLEASFGERAQVGGPVLGPLYALSCGGAEQHQDGDEHAHEAGACDPHVWTDPANAGLWALMIRDTLSALNPEAAATYAANTDAYLAELVALDGEIRDMIDTIPPERRAIVTNHVALTYFAERYGLTLAGVVIPGGSTTSEPSVRDVLRLIDTIRAARVPAIFTDTTASSATAEQIASEAGVHVVPLYTGSLSQPGEGADTYLDYMRYNAAAIADALR